MATTPPMIGGSDPSVLRSLETPTPSVARTSPPTVSASTGSATSGGTAVARGIAPQVSGATTTYNQATQTASGTSLTITSATSNDPADVVTVYNTNKAISVSAVNQTVSTYNVNNYAGNEYTNSDVANYLPTFTGNVGAGNVNVTGTVYTSGISSTGSASLTILNVSTTANLGAVGNLIITGGSNGQVLSTNGNGVLSWANNGGGSSYGNSDVANYLPTFTGNISAGNVNLSGNIIGSNTIEIDNRASGNTADINLYAADDITIQARDRAIGSTSEGGDINIFAGDSAEDSDSSGGDIQIIAGNGGNANVDFAGLGGFITIASGRGGNASTGVGNYPAEDGGQLTLRAGDAGNNNGNIDRGADGGFVYIESGDSTGNGKNGGGITLTTGLGGANALAGDVEINIPSSDLGAGGTWIFTGTGNLNLPTNGSLNLSGGGINQDNNETLLITTFDDNGIVSSSLELSPGDTTRLEQWSSQQSDTFTTADWTTGVYINQGGQGAVQFTSAANIIAFVNSLDGVGHIYFSVNGGTQLVYDGTSSGGGNITFNTPTPPATSPTVVTSFEYFYSYKSGFEIVSGESNDVNIYGGDAEITLQTTGQQDINLDSSGDVILTANSTVNWTFATTGNLTLPGNTFAVNYANGDQVSIGGNTGNVTFNDINIIGDGNLKLQPDSANANAYLNIYLTSGPDIHIAGNGETVILGTDDFANITVNVDGNVSIQANAGTPYTWQFDTTGNLTLPLGSTINNAPDIITVTLDQFTDGGYPGPQVFTKVSDTLYELSSGGPYMTLISGIWRLKISTATYYDSTDLITWSPVAGVLPAPVGSPTAVVTMNLETGGNVWTFGGDGSLTLPIGVSIDYNGNIQYPRIIADSEKLFSVQGQGNSGSAALAWTVDPDAASQYAAVAVSRAGDNLAKVVLQAQSDSGNVATVKLWNFDETGNLTLPGNTFAVNYANGAQVSLGGSSSSIANGNSNVSIATANGNVTINAVGNTTMTVTGTGANVTGTLTSTGKIGYASGSSVTQLTSRGTGVTINTLAGTIITTSVAMVASEIDTFSVTNSSVDPTSDIVLAQIVSPNQGTYNCIANPAVIGGFNPGFFLNIVNISGFTTSDETITIRFMVIKAPNA